MQSCGNHLFLQARGKHLLQVRTHTRTSPYLPRGSTLGVSKQELIVVLNASKVSGDSHHPCLSAVAT